MRKYLGLRADRSEGSRALVRRRRVLPHVALSVIIASTAIVFGISSSSGAASTATYQVEVYGTITWGQSPQFGIRVESTLPAGAAITGSVTCTTAYVSNVPSPIANLNAGSYELDTTTCKSTPTYPLTLKGTTGRMQILGGEYTVNPDPTAIVGGVNVTRKNPTAPAVLFTAELFQTGDTDSLLGTQKLTFMFQNTAGVPVTVFPGCTTQQNLGTVTTPSTHIQTTPPTSFAVCGLNQQASTEFVDGTGKVEINYSGTSLGNYAPSTALGSYPTAKTTATEAAINLQRTEHARMVVVPTRTPRTCHPNATQTGVSIIGVSLEVLTCKTLKILQTVVGDVLALGNPLGFVSTYIVTPIVKAVFVEKAKQAIQQQEQNRGQPRETTFSVIDEEEGLPAVQAGITDATEGLEAADFLGEF